MLLFFQNETVFGTRLIVHMDRLPHDRKLAASQLFAMKGPVAAIPISQRRNLRPEADGRVSEVTQAVLRSRLELKLKPWTPEPANRLDPASQGAMETWDGLTQPSCGLRTGSSYLSAIQAVAFMITPSCWPSAKGPASKVNRKGLFHLRNHLAALPVGLPHPHSLVPCSRRLPGPGTWAIHGFPGDLDVRTGLERSGSSHQVESFSELRGAFSPGPVGEGPLTGHLMQKESHPLYPEGLSRGGRPRNPVIVRLRPRTQMEKSSKEERFLVT